VSLFDLIGRLAADRRMRKLLRGAVPSSVDQIRAGSFVKLTATVEPHDGRVLEAPLSGRLCAYYSIEVVGWPYTVLRRSRPVDVTDEQECVPFRLAAVGATVVVDPTDAWVSSGFDYRLRERDEVRDPRARAFYERTCDAARRWSELHFREAVLGIGERVVLFGAAVDAATREQAGERGYRDTPARRLVFHGSAKYPLVIRDDVRDL